MGWIQLGLGASAVGPFCACGASTGGARELESPAGLRALEKSPEQPGAVSDAKVVQDCRSDALWRRAEAEDAIDLGRLARREGAQQLLGRSRCPGSVAATALLAFPFSSDSPEWMGELCQDLGETPADQRLTELRLLALLQVLEGGVRPQLQVAPRLSIAVDPAAMSSCLVQLSALEINDFGIRDLRDVIRSRLQAFSGAPQEAVPAPR